MKRAMEFLKKITFRVIVARKCDSTKPWSLVCDVDGVLTDGKFWYSAKGKELKLFGSHDSDALKSQTTFNRIKFVTADTRGLKISQRRLKDMGFEVEVLDSDARKDLVERLGISSNVAFIGDSFSDIPAMRVATLSAAPFGSFPSARRAADVKLSCPGGAGALAELVLLFEDNLSKRRLT
jgi:3-deoxy-D-manno-octulosonate 8-phosphate phosphatase (KDO 8-P phosphatase)